MVAGLLLANLFAWSAVVQETPRGLLQVTFLDIGQGDAIYIRAPNGNDLLIDGGPGRSILTALSRVLPFYDRSINLLLASHTDSDHIGGFPAVLTAYRADGYVHSGVSSGTALAQELTKLIGEKNIKSLVVARGTTIWLDRQTKLEILFPERTALPLDTNQSSLIAKLSYGSSTFLFTGDTTKQVEDYLAGREGNNLRVGVLKVSHHGSKNSSSFAFTGFTQPDYAVISVGAKNRYGHPHQEVLAMLDQLGINTLRTDKLGDITFQSTGQQVKYVEK